MLKIRGAVDLGWLLGALFLGGGYSSQTAREPSALAPLILLSTALLAAVASNVVLTAAHCFDDLPLI